MKLNFWQVLGLILVILAIVLIYRRDSGKKPLPVSTPPAATTNG